jgi:hypothetical protein
MVAVALDVSERPVLYLSPHVRQSQVQLELGTELGLTAPQQLNGSQLPGRFKSTAGYFRATLSVLSKRRMNFFARSPSPAD